MTEFGVRLALGAEPGDLSRLVLGFGARLATLGMLAGVPAALFFGQVLAALLEGIGGATPAAWVIVPLTLTVTVIAAAVLPARRASRVDPIVALRAH
jgi:putative ABC transport system permease protein